MLDKYRDYFDIDPEYFPQINEKVINNNPDIWKKFYPHETFVKLLKDTVSVLSRKQKVSIWVEGAYGTGKSHAVLTLKKLLEASPEDTKAYFDKYPDQLSNADTLHVKTKHHPEEYPYALFRISEEANPYDALCRIDQSTEALAKDMGTDEQWAYALTLLQEHGDWVNAINHEIGLYSNLELFINASQDYTDAKKWLYFIALKRFGAKNECLDLASQKAQAYEELVRWIVRGLVDLDCKSPVFWNLYDCRKAWMQVTILFAKSAT